MERDFTCIDDIVEGIIKLINKIPVSNKEWNESKNDLKYKLCALQNIQYWKL